MTHLFPLHTERTVPNMDGLKPRWEKIMQSALQQSEQPYLPKLHPPLSLVGFLDKKFPFLIYGDETRQGPTLKEILRNTPPQPIALLVGPEGGWEEEERDRLRGYGRGVRLTHHILRSETSALFMIGSVVYEWGG